MAKEKKEEEKKETNKQKDKSEEKEKQDGIPSIALSMEEFEKMENQIQQLQAQANEYLDDLQRERAAFSNYKKRIDTENLSVYDNALANISKSFLTIADDIERAINNVPSDSFGQSWVSGINLILQKLVRTLENHGIEKIEIKPGDFFDPTDAEAISHEEHSDYNDGQIIEVLQPGYKIKNRIIRPALVRVAK